MSALKVGFIGAGNMTQMILQGLKQSGHIPMESFFVADVIQNRAAKVGQEYGAQVVPSNEEIFDNCQVIVLAVKPDQIRSVLEPLRGAIIESHIILSIAAGVALKDLRNLVQNARVARLMPNTPISVGHGVVGVYADKSDQSLLTVIEDIFAPIATLIPMAEEHTLDVLTVACGSGPGFLFEVMQIWQEWIEQFDIDERAARTMVIQTFLGSAFLANSAKENFYALQEKVVSKKGVTEHGLQGMRDGNIDGILRIGFEKAMMRAKSLQRQTGGGEA